MGMASQLSMTAIPYIPQLYIDDLEGYISPLPCIARLLKGYILF